MAERLIRIQNKLGLHARASAKLATQASSFDCEVILIKDEIQVNAKSIMGIMMLAACKGTELGIRAEGNDADAALDAIETLVNNRFGEEQ